MSRLLVILLVAASAVVAALPDGADAAETTAGPLRVGAEVPQPAFWNDVTPGAPGTFAGFEYDLATMLATKLGKNGITVVKIPFASLIAGKAKGYDLALEEALIPKAKAPVDFSTPYLDFDLGILVRSGTSVADIPSAQKLHWGVATSMPAPLTYLQRTLRPDSPPTTYPDLAQAVSALEQQQVDAVLDYTVSVMKQAGGSAGRLVVVGQFRSGEKIGAVLPKRSRLLKSVNAGIKALKADGTIGRLATLYLGGDPSTVPFLNR